MKHTLRLLAGLLARPLLIFACIALAGGCNTMEGAGEDIESAGDAIQDAAD